MAAAPALATSHRFSSKPRFGSDRPSPAMTALTSAATKPPAIAVRRAVNTLHAHTPSPPAEPQRPSAQDLLQARHLQPQARRLRRQAKLRPRQKRQPPSTPRLRDFHRRAANLPPDPAKTPATAVHPVAPSATCRPSPVLAAQGNPEASPPRPPRNFDGGERTKDFAPRKPFTAHKEVKAELAEPRASATSPGLPADRDAPRSPRPFRPQRRTPRRPRSGFAEKKPYSKSEHQRLTRSRKSLRQIQRRLRRKVQQRLPQKIQRASPAKSPTANPPQPGSGKPASTFDKFKGNKKPFGKRAPTRKFKPE